MREDEEAIVGDEEGRREETPSSSSTIPPDHLRCNRTDGKKWRCKRWKFQSSLYCEMHYKQRRRSRKLTTILKHKKVPPKRRRYIDYYTSTEEEEDDDPDEDSDEDSDEDYSDEDSDSDFIPTKKSRNDNKDSDNKEINKYNISELIIYLKSSFRKQEFENIEKILQMREDKIKMEKQEAEKQAAQFKEELGVFETMCGQLTSEVEEKKKAIFEVNDTLLEMEIKNFNIQQELERCKKINNQLEEKVGRLEKELEIVGERERRSEERFTKMSWDLRERIRELERKNRDLETDKRIAELQGSRKINAEPRGSESNVCCSKEGKNNESEKWRLEGVIEMESTKHDRGFYAPANSDSISHSLTRARVPEEAKKCETSCVLKDACSPNLKEVSNSGGRIFGSAKVDLDCCSPSGESRVAQLAGLTKKSESKQIKFQNEATHALEGATLSQIKIKEEALNCDEKLCISPTLDSICHFSRGKNSQESPLSTQRSVSPLVFEERKVSQSGQTKFQREASCALSGVKLSQVKIKEEPLHCDERFSASARVDSASHSIGGDDVKDASISTSRSILLQQFEQKRSAADQILSNQFEIIGTSCKQSRNSIAENDGEKVTKELGADCDGISAFLCELRRFKANKANMTLKHL